LAWQVLVAEKPEDPRKGQNASKHETKCLLGHCQPPSLILL
jgi:hypothetical protein